MNRPIAAIFCLGLTLLGCGKPTATDSSEAPTAGEQSNSDAEQPADENAAELQLANYDTIAEFIGTQTGKVVVVDLWSTSCVPCMEEFPRLVALSNSHPEDVACVSVNLDYIGLKRKPAASYQDDVTEFLQSQNATLTNFLASETDEVIRDKFEITSIPAIVVYDQSGKLAARLSEATSGDEGLSYEAHVIPLVNKLLAQQQ
ncbi:MAG: hypothetical protein Aurels2KO_05810 [Aureliella sp.]